MIIGMILQINNPVKLISSGTAKEFASEAENLLKCISLSVLCRLAEKEMEVFSQGWNLNIFKMSSDALSNVINF